MLDPADRPYAQLLIEARIRDGTGFIFEEFFQSIAGAAYGSDFIATIPMGSRGDRKCDGYRLSTGTVYQAYAPRAIHVDRLIKKIGRDFVGARQHWPRDMREWRLVHNAPALPAEAVALLARLNRKYPSIKVNHLPPSELVNLAIGIPRGPLERFVGRIPSVSELRKLNFEEIDDLMLALEAIDTTPSLAVPTIPSPAKLSHNRLPDHIALLLRGQEVVTRQFQAYFSDTHRTDIGNRASEKMRVEYERRRDRGEPPEAIFWGLVEFAGGLEGSHSRRRALLGFLAYLFFSCEIFENVPKSVAVV